MTEYPPLSDADREALRFVPLAVFDDVALADGKIHFQEAHEFRVAIGEVSQNRSPDFALVREVCREIDRDFDAVETRFRVRCAKGLTTGRVLRDAALILRQAEPAQAAAFKVTMMRLGRRVAEIRPILGPKISRGEAKALEDIRQRLGLEAGAEG